MFQSFDATTRPEDGPKRLAALRTKMDEIGVDAFVVPRSDAHQGEYVAPCDERLAWLTGFTGSAGFCAVLQSEAGLFVDGRYTVQARNQVDTNHFDIVSWPKTKLTAWLAERAAPGDKIAIDPWLHTTNEVEALKKEGLEVVFVDNLIDMIWDDRPAPPKGKVEVYPNEYSGMCQNEKRGMLGAELERSGPANAILTLPDAISWLLNIRGNDLKRIPTVRAFAILNWTDAVQLFTDAELGEEALEHIGQEVEIYPYDGLLDYLDTCERSTFRVDPKTAPHAIRAHIEAMPEEWMVKVEAGADPTLLPKAKKNAAEIAGTTEAHLRDGAAVTEFLAWLETANEVGDLTEIDIVEKLEAFRRETGALRDISFDTIAGTGPHGAIVHYRVTRETNRTISPGDLLLIDSGGQYIDGTTDITRTIAIGPPGDDEIAAFTRVLQGVIAISRIRWPEGLAGRDLDPLARASLWMAGQDFDHGTGHGVGVFLSVHEGPQRLSRLSHVPLEPGMILSNEPGYYREGAFGIRIENLVVVETAPKLDGGDDRDHLAFRTLTFVPIDKRLIDAERLSHDERSWLNDYHREVNRLISPRVSENARAWLRDATQPI